MATYTTSGYYTVTEMNGQFVVGSVYRSARSTLVNDSAPDNIFRVGDHVTVTDDTGYTSAEIVVGFTSDGVITVDDQGNYNLTTNNASYAYGQPIDSNADDFPVCFVKGTLIDTDRGPVAIESLRVGDKVLGSTGYRTVKWIGWRHYHAVALRTPEQRVACLPIRIEAGALGRHLPSQDLLVSPWHHIFIDGLLVRAKDLLNGVSIVQDTHLTEFSYYHLELDQFDVVRAYGVFSESWADGGNRSFFQNVNVTSLRPEDNVRRLANRPGFRVVRKAAEIAGIQKNVAASRASTLFADAAPH
jgi:hypothetical protein